MRGEGAVVDGLAVLEKVGKGKKVGVGVGKGGWKRVRVRCIVRKGLA